MPCPLFTLGGTDGELTLSGHLLDRLYIESQINLQPDNDRRHVGFVVSYFWKPLFLDVVERRARYYVEADDEYVCLRV